MFSVSLVQIPETLNFEDLNGLTWQRHENFDLRSVIQFQQRLAEDGELPWQPAMAIHQYVGAEPTIEQDDEGTYLIRYENVVKTEWSYLSILPNLMLVDRLCNRGYVLNIINKGLNPPQKAVNVYLDTTAMAETFANQWVRGFDERAGRVDRGLVYGDSVEQDAVFGPELNRSASKSIGWTTNYFGTPMKVRASQKGSITIFGNPRPLDFLGFLRTSILPHVVTNT